MTPNEYQTKALRTARIATEDFTDLMHGAIGVITEGGELLEALHTRTDFVNIREELGDIAWYLALLCRATGSTIEELMPFAKIDVGVHAHTYIIIEGARLLDLVKKERAYGKPVDLHAARQHTANLIGAVMTVCESLFVDPSKMFETNIAKLAQRYPEKFTEENAAARNLDAERAALS